MNVWSSSVISTWTRPWIWRPLIVGSCPWSLLWRIMLILRLLLRLLRLLLGLRRSMVIIRWRLMHIWHLTWGCPIIIWGCRGRITVLNWHCDQVGWSLLHHRGWRLGEIGQPPTLPGGWNPHFATMVLSLNEGSRSGRDGLGRGHALGAGRHFIRMSKLFMSLQVSFWQIRPSAAIRAIAGASVWAHVNTTEASLFYCQNFGIATPTGTSGLLLYCGTV